jgi:hypothetical protein
MECIRRGFFNAKLCSAKELPPTILGPQIALIQMGWRRRKIEGDCLGLPRKSGHQIRVSARVVMHQDGSASAALLIEGEIAVLPLEESKWTSRRAPSGTTKSFRSGKV